MEQEQIKKIKKLFAVILKPYFHNKLDMKKFLRKYNDDNKKNIHKENKHCRKLSATSFSSFLPMLSPPNVPKWANMYTSHFL
jgi:hypothetical protein